MCWLDNLFLSSSCFSPLHFWPSLSEGWGRCTSRTMWIHSILPTFIRSADIRHQRWPERWLPVFFTKWGIGGIRGTDGDVSRDRSYRQVMQLDCFLFMFSLPSLYQLLYRISPSSYFLFHLQILLLLSIPLSISSYKFSAHISLEILDYGPLTPHSRSVWVKAF